MYLYIDFYFCLVILYLYLYLFLVQNYLCKNRYWIGLKQHVEISMIPVHAIRGLCWYNFSVSPVSSCSFPGFWVSPGVYFWRVRPLIDHEIIPDPPERSKGKGKGDKGKKGDDGEKGEDRGGLSDFEGESGGTSSCKCCGVSGIPWMLFLETELIQSTWNSVFILRTDLKITLHFLQSLRIYIRRSWLMQCMYLVVMCSTVSQAIVTARATGTGMTGTGAETEAGIETEIVNWADF